MFEGRGMPKTKAQFLAEQEYCLVQAKNDMILRGIPIADGDYDRVKAGMAVGKTVGVGLGTEGFAEAYGNQEEEANRQERAREYVKIKLPEWIAAGNDLVFNAKLEAWEAEVKRCAEGPLHGYDVDSAIKIMQMLDKGTPVKDIVGEIKPEGLAAINLIRDFSKRGPEYIRGFASCLGTTLKPEIEEKLQQIESQNLEYAKAELKANNEKHSGLTTELEAVDSAAAEIKEGIITKEEVVQQ